MQEIFENELNLEFFKERGYVRKRCSKCKEYFWTLDKDAKLCGDQPCVNYTFIKNPPTKKRFNISQMREAFLSFFEKNRHTILKRYPVVARWRDDIYLTIASIADFQPHITSGEVKPPANPLVISQPSIRLNDLEEIGVSGRHLTIFEMMGHHAFNSKDERIYWTEETTRYCHDFLTKILGIPEEKINYKEQIWYGGGNAGPCFEVLVDGLEVATLVFMNLIEDPDGYIKVNNTSYSKMPLEVVDTGYGLERLAWLTQGTETIYETVFPEVIEFILENSKSHDGKIQEVYSLADHTKCLAFMLGDGIVPSNAKAGYLARLIIRRALRFMDSLKINLNLSDIVELQLNILSNDFPELRKARNQIIEILDLETEKFYETVERGERLIKNLIEKNKKIDEKTLVDLYDTHGIHPDIVKRVASSAGVDIKVPENFESMVAELHSHEKKVEKKKTLKLDLPDTRLLYYEDEYAKEFEADVIWSGRIENKFAIALDRTLFYPEGGGQPADKGYIKTETGKNIPVEHVERAGNIILHFVKEEIKNGEKVKGVIDWNRRYSLMKHHTSTHLINGACRRLLGEHVWQAGSQLEVDSARFDFSHYKPLTFEEVYEIEKLANEFVKRNINVKKMWMDRNEAERKYGFRLYQGGVPKGKKLRVLYIKDVDVEACGGTHLNKTGEAEIIKIQKTERIQDGVIRIIFSAGSHAKKFIELERSVYKEAADILSKFYEVNEEKNISISLREAADVFSVSIEQLPKTLDRFVKETSNFLQQLNEPVFKEKTNSLGEACKKLFESWKKYQKKLEKKREKIINDLSNNLVNQMQKINDIGLIAEVLDIDEKTLASIADSIVG
ncbi:MAG TPA: alanine--tRNA ligase, partial [Thermoplasmatales archaeon]|nr:alanine--tRNA ligase [Thermoplasmatales archaeon]HEX08545.1 alanine--tRNA ligase [Thermoplasmatales archaeon]